MAPRTRLASYPLVLLLGSIPLYIGAVGLYGQKVLAILALSLVSGFLTDLVAFKLRRDESPRWSWLVWLIYPLALPAGVPLWTVPLGMIFCLTFTVHFFGGYGRNLFPVATVGVLFLILSYSGLVVINTKPFTEPTMGFHRWASQVPIAGNVFSDLKTFGDIIHADFLYGKIPGSIGESYGVYLIVFAFLMLVTGLLDYRFGLPAILGTAFLSWLGHRWFPDRVLEPGFQLLIGSFLLYISFFIPSDPFALPRTPEGRWIGGLLFALFTVLIRGFSGFTEGVFFAGLLTSVFTPFIDQQIGERLYGKQEKSA